MKGVTVSAPGKMVLTGEYAVLEGAPAVVMAVSARARVTLQPAAEGYTIDAHDLGVDGARAQVLASRPPTVQWLGAATGSPQRLQLVRHVLEDLAARQVPAPFHAQLDTSAFFSAANGAKLGLGSSAALTVALAGAVRVHDGLSTLDVADLVTMHRRLQNNRGSGLDIAASVNGGVIVYRLQRGRPHVRTAQWPEALHTCFVWSGRSASTSAFLQQLAHWRQHAPERFAVRMRDLGDRAEAAEKAVGSGDATTLLAAVKSYAQALQQLGEASGLDIVSAEHRHIGAIAADCGIVYKTCGAGGGDIGMALALDPERMQSFHTRLQAARIRTFQAQVDPDGIRLH